MKQLRNTLLAGLIAVTSIVSAFPSGAMTHFYAQSGRDGIYVFVRGHFTPNKLTTSTQYGLKKGRYVKGISIYLKEGSYYAEKHDRTGGMLIQLSKINDPRYKDTGTWKWHY